MRQAGQIVLFRFPQTDLMQGKLRPALLLGRLPGPYDDWLVSMISSQTQHYIEGFDEIVHRGDSDYAVSGLKATSVIRVGRLAVVQGQALLGAIGEVSSRRLRRVKARLADWLPNAETAA
jgi:mRNA interferase MazF